MIKLSNEVFILNNFQSEENNLQDELSIMCAFTAHVWNFYTEWSHKTLKNPQNIHVRERKTTTEWSSWEG